MNDFTTLDQRQINFLAPPGYEMEEIEDDGRKIYEFKLRVTWKGVTQEKTAHIPEEEIVLTHGGEVCLDSLNKLLEEKTATFEEEIVAEMKIEGWWDGVQVKLSV